MNGGEVIKIAQGHEFSFTTGDAYAEACDDMYM